MFVSDTHETAVVQVEGVSAGAEHDADEDRVQQVHAVRDAVQGQKEVPRQQLVYETCGSTSTSGSASVIRSPPRFTCMYRVSRACIEFHVHVSSFRYLV